MAAGYGALFSHADDSGNTASGVNALSANKGSGNTALLSNTTAGQNVAVGCNALLAQSFSHRGVAWNTDNVALGFEALYDNQSTDITIWLDNTAVGTQAIRSNTMGVYNTAIGH